MRFNQKKKMSKMMDRQDSEVLYNKLQIRIKQISRMISSPIRNILQSKNYHSQSSMDNPASNILVNPIDRTHRYFLSVNIGICTSDGSIHDFAGPYTIGVDNFAFGRPLKYVPLNSDKKINQRIWDDSVNKAD